MEPLWNLMATLRIWTIMETSGGHCLEEEGACSGSWPSSSGGYTTRHQMELCAWSLRLRWSGTSQAALGSLNRSAISCGCFFYIIGGHIYVLLWAHEYTYFRLLVISLLIFKTREGHLVVYVVCVFTFGATPANLFMANKLPSLVPMRGSRELNQQVGCFNRLGLYLLRSWRHRYLVTSSLSLLCQGQNTTINAHFL